MGNTVKYTGNQKEFKVSKTRLKLKKSVVLVFLSLLIVIFTGLSVLYINLSQNRNNDYELINFQERGDLLFKVYYEQSPGFNEGYQDNDLTYVANLIDHIKIDFNYSINSEENLETEYYYEIVADTYINNANGSKGVIKAESKVLKKSDVIFVSDKGFDIIDSIQIDYDLFNEEVNVLKNEHGLQITAELEVSMNVYTTVKHGSVTKTNNINNSLGLKFPLVEQVVDISLEADKIDNSLYLTDYEENKFNTYFYLGMASALLALISVIYLVVFIYKKYFNKDIYESTIKKYLREYDRLIVTSKQPDLDESSFINKIRVMSIEELIDAHDSTGAPIIYYEVVPNEKSYFIIIDNNTLYKLTISRVFLEENKK